MTWDFERINLFSNAQAVFEEYKIEKIKVSLTGNIHRLQVAGSQVELSQGNCVGVSF